MPVTPYVVFANSDTSIDGKVRLVYEGYQEIVDRPADVQRTIGGGIDVTMGGPLKIYHAFARVRHTEPEGSEYLTIGDLEALYLLNDPNGDPSNVISFTDNHGSELTVYMLGSFAKQVMGIEIEGTESWYLVELELLVIP